MLETLSVLALFGGTFAFIALGLHFGFKWIDKALHYQPLDTSKPIVRKWLEDPEVKAALHRRPR